MLNTNDMNYCLLLHGGSFCCLSSNFLTFCSAFPNLVINPPEVILIAAAIKVLSDTKSGVAFNYTDQNGKTGSMVEAQVVAEILLYFRELTQVMLGEAISSSELIEFLRSNGLS